MEAENKKDQTLEDVFEQLDEVVKKIRREKLFRLRILFNCIMKEWNC